MNEEAMTRVGPQRYSKKKIKFKMGQYGVESACSGYRLVAGYLKDVS
jgi:hypothetical protein